MAGTSSTSIGLCSCMAFNTLMGSKNGTMTCVPSRMVSPHQAARSARWNMGAACSSTDPALGNPVVPPVWQTPARSSPLR